MEKNVRTIGWLLLLGQFFFQTSTMLITFIAAFMANGNFGMGVIVGSDVGSFIANVIILGTFWLIKKKDIRLSGKKTKESWYLVGLAWILLILWNCVCSFVDVATSHVLSVPFDEESRISFGFQMLTMAIFPAIVEEFAFRKVIFGVLRKYGFSLAAIFSSLCFGLMHQNVIQIIFATVMGIIMCYVYEHTGKLYYCMLLHFMNNGISVVLAYSPAYMKYGAYMEATIGIIAIFIFVIAVIRRKIRFQELLQINEQYTYKDMMKNIGCCFKRVPVIIFTMFCIGMSVVAIIIT